MESFYRPSNNNIMNLQKIALFELREEKAITQESFKIDKNLPNKLDNLLKEGTLDKETEILRILEDLSEKLNSLENKEEKSVTPENEDDKRKNRIHQKWGKDPFSQEI
jgi:hypothetical protein